MGRRWLLLLGLLFVVGQQPAVACSCAPSTKPQLVENAAVIFAGTATGTSRGFPSFSFGSGCSASSTDPISVTFAVETVYKGEVAKNTTVRTVVGGASCGYEFQSGKRYTVFATFVEDRLETNLCRGNVEGAIAPADYGLREGRAPQR